MISFESITIISIFSTVILGIYNLVLNLRGQRKTHRELIFTKQIEFFIELQTILTEIENTIEDFRVKQEEVHALKEKLFHFIIAFDRHIDKNDIIIPDILYDSINISCAYYFELFSKISLDTSLITTQLISEVLNENMDLTSQIRDYIGLEHLSEENRKLVKGRFIKKQFSAEAK